ncbi:hypothetical protein KP509_16G037300 [Ceratopteris richardii]|uniref:RING-type E3 ubiquitin transferase n=1 Tax=Ceratopteris richardii TaxID=49495 RepID=A0A8T2T2F0_CERRI|nr:hypothetical protein KP509_16G037300 [Ceratopteris richardii]KAH7387704.1 hypothetical protein KP509_16G037300 [Ceratopteris richardii]
MSDLDNEFIHVADVIISSNNGDGLHLIGALGRSFWCNSCNRQVLIRGREGTCPRCRSENTVPLDRFGRGNTDSWQSGLPPLRGMLTGHNEPRLNNPWIVPSTQQPWLGRWVLELPNNLEDIVNNQRPHAYSSEDEDNGRADYPFISAAHLSPSWSPEDVNTSTFSSPGPGWQQFMREMLWNMLGRRGRSPSFSPGRLAADPGDYMDDANGFDRLLSEIAENDNENHGAPPAAKQAVRELPLVPIEQRHIDDDSATCPICKELMELGEMAKELPCQHLYHESCIVPWLNVRNSCPVCRFELPTDDPQYEARRQGLVNDDLNVTGQERVSGANGRDSWVPGERDEGNLGMRDAQMREIEDELESYPNEESHSHDGWVPSWLWCAARRFFSMMGFLLALTVGHRLILAEEPVHSQLARDQVSNVPRP